jgi:amidohydrolase
MKSLIAAALMFAASAHADLRDAIDDAAAKVEQRVVAWRRDIHQHPELSNREERTASLVAKHLKSLGIETKTGVAHTGVVGVLKGGRPGGVVALRADMDALPVVEQTGLPYASTVKSTYQGQEVGVMHACGHDTHVAMLMGVATVLAGVRDQLPGTVKLIFQPAEEGPPPGENGGARMMVEEGVLDDPAPTAIFGLHVGQDQAVGEASYRGRA